MELQEALELRKVTQTTQKMMGDPRFWLMKTLAVREMLDMAYMKCVTFCDSLILWTAYAIARYQIRGITLR